MLLVGYLTYHLVLIFLGLYFFMFIFLISFTWIVKSLKGEINYYILIPRMFKSKKSALQRALLNRKKKKIIRHPFSARNCGKCFTFIEDIEVNSTTSTPNPSFVQQQRNDL